MNLAKFSVALYGRKGVIINKYIIKTIFCALLLIPEVQAVNVISNVMVNVDSLSRTQLRRIYSMRQTHWSNGTPIVIYILSDNNATHQKFCKEQLRLFPYQLDRIWHKLTFSGYGIAPIPVATEKELIEAVRSTKGSVGYVENLSEVTDVNIIKIDD